jgi:hypothetical protein
MICSFTNERHLSGSATIFCAQILSMQYFGHIQKVTPPQLIEPGDFSDLAKTFSLSIGREFGEETRAFSRHAFP